MRGSLHVLAMFGACTLAGCFPWGQCGSWNNVRFSTPLADANQTLSVGMGAAQAFSLSGDANQVVGGLFLPIYLSSNDTTPVDVPMVAIYQVGTDAAPDAGILAMQTRGSFDPNNGGVYFGGNGTLQPNTGYALVVKITSGSWLLGITHDASPPQNGAYAGGLKTYDGNTQTWSPDADANARLPFGLGGIFCE